VGVDYSDIMSYLAADAAPPPAGLGLTLFEPLPVKLSAYRPACRGRPRRPHPSAASGQVGWPSFPQACGASLRVRFDRTQNVGTNSTIYCKHRA
jgi:hypothetical protein